MPKSTAAIQLPFRSPLAMQHCFASMSRLAAAHRHAAGPAGMRSRAARFGGWIAAACVAACGGVAGYAGEPIAAAARPATMPAASGPHGLTVEGGRLRMHGRPYRGIGINQADLFQELLKNPGSTRSLDGLRFLGRKNIPFVRFWCCGFWPCDWDLFLKDRQEWFRRLDLVVRTAEEAGVGLLPSLFWRADTVSDLCRDYTDAWADPTSRTRHFMVEYTREVVLRYRGSPAVWGWEFANEWNLQCDLPHGLAVLGHTDVNLGVNRERDPRNLLTSKIAAAALEAFAEEVRRHDPHRFITAGHSLPRASAWHQSRENSWQADDRAEVIKMLRLHNPAPLDVVSIHVYPQPANELRLGDAVGTRQVLTLLKEAAAAAGQPLFVGEFSAGGGHKGPAGIPMEDFRAQQAEMLTAMADARVDLAAHWVFGLGEHPLGPGLVREGNEYEWVLDEIAAWNQRLAPDDAQDEPPVADQ